MDPPWTLRVGEALQEIELSLVSRKLPDPICNGTDVVQLLAEQLRPLHREAFLVLPLNSKNQPLGLHMASIGTPTSSLVHPREVFLPAILSAASAVVVAHNHPSGDPSPSSEDRTVTMRLREAGDLLGIPLLDHLVLGRDQFFSFAEERVLPIP